MYRPGMRHHTDCSEDQYLRSGLPADKGLIRLEEAQKDGPSSISGERYSVGTFRPAARNVRQNLKTKDITRAAEGGSIGFDHLNEPVGEPIACYNKKSGDYNATGPGQVVNQTSKTFVGTSQPNADINTEARVPGDMSTGALELLAETASRTAWQPLPPTPSSQFLPGEKGSDNRNDSPIIDGSSAVHDAPPSERGLCSFTHGGGNGGVIEGGGALEEKQASLQSPQQDLYPPYSPPPSTSVSRTRNDKGASHEECNRNIDHNLRGKHCGETNGTGWECPVLTTPLPRDGNFVSGNGSTQPPQNRGPRSSHPPQLDTTSMFIENPGCSIRSGHDAVVSARGHRSISPPRRKGRITPDYYRASSNQPRGRRSPSPLRIPGSIIPATFTSKYLPREGIGQPLTDVPRRPVKRETRIVEGECRQPTSPQSAAHQQDKTHREEIVDETKGAHKRRRNAHSSGRTSITEKRLLDVGADTSAKSRKKKSLLWSQFRKACDRCTDKKVGETSHGTLMPGPANRRNRLRGKKRT